MNAGDPDTVLDLAIEAFLALLRAGWGNIKGLAAAMGKDPEEFLSDWAQANWEAVVEAAISPRGRTFIEPYGDGADCNPVGSRVWMAGVASTHAVHCVPRSGTSAWDYLMGEEVEFPQTSLLVDRFAIATADGWYAEQPPFDHVLTTFRGREALFRLSDVRFVLREVTAG
jgi:hypothetical protein